MAALPQKPGTAELIFESLEKGVQELPRAHLGASQIGQPCARALWYQFRWAAPERHQGRILRLFRRGQAEEKDLVADLRAAGLTVFDVDPSTNGQFSVSAHGGHFGGSMDGVAKNVPESSADEKWHVLEFKTMATKTFAKLKREGVEKCKPEHFAQMQTYMHLSGKNNDERMTRALYVAVNKNDDHIYTERVKYDHALAKTLLTRAADIIFTDEAPDRISNDPTWWQCKFCTFSPICHAGVDPAKAVPAVSCRTCVHATVEPDGNAAWSCAQTGEQRSVAQQRAACTDHVFLPSTIAFAQPGDGSSTHNWQEYKLPDNRTFKNGSASKGVFTSEELSALDIRLLGDPGITAMKAQFPGAKIEGRKRKKQKEKADDEPFFDDPIPF